MELYHGDGLPVPLVARLLAPPWLARVRRARLDTAWRWPDSVAGLTALLCELEPEQVPGIRSAMRMAEQAAARLWHQALRLGYGLALESLPGYPPELGHAEVWLLWTRAVPSAFAPPRIAIVGSRDATPYALLVAEQLARDLAEAGFTVVSGLARGVDSAAHRGALQTGATVAVFGSGLDTVYPREHAGLADAISTRGALVSEFSPGTPPRAAHFPQRNRVIAALSLAVVVVEAGEKSGSLSTARWALDLGRDVLVVPGQVLHGKNRGGHALLRDGATLVEDAGQVMSALGLESRAVVNAGLAGPSTTGPAEQVFDSFTLSEGEIVEAEALATKTGCSVDHVLRELSRLELQGRISRVGPGRFVCVSRK